MEREGLRLCVQTRTLIDLTADKMSRAGKRRSDIDKERKGVILELNIRYRNELGISKGFRSLVSNMNIEGEIKIRTNFAATGCMKIKDAQT